MIITRTPFRISFFGGGTDYPAWYRNHGGAVVGATINKYCYITCRYLPPFFEHRIRVVYSQIENCESVDDIQHPSVRETLRYLGINRGVEIHHDGDLPARGGIGSSSSFTVGLLKALYALQGRTVSKRELVRDAIYIEQERLKETVGSQDQVLVAHGGINHVEFHPTGDISVNPLCLTREAAVELNNHMLLFFTGVHRTASHIAKSYVDNLMSKESEIKAISQMVTESLDILNRSDFPRFGRLLHDYWCLKQSLSNQVTNPQVNQLYAAATAAGAIGGKLIGAGGGGYILLFAHPHDHPRIFEALKNLVHIPFRFEFSGSQVSFFDPEEDYLAQENLRSKQEVQPFQDLHNDFPKGNSSVVPPPL